MSPASKAQQQAVAKYESKNYDKYLLRMPKGKKEDLQVHTQQQGKSLNEFINEAIDEKIKCDNEKKAGD